LENEVSKNLDSVIYKFKNR